MTALQLLQQMDFEAKRDLYKSTPLHAIPKTKFSDKTSNGLTQCILTWLKLHNHYATRINTMGRKLKDTVIVDVIGRAHITPGKWVPGTTRKGTSDIHSVINSKHASIEVKVGRDTMSDDQIKTKQQVENSGGLFFIAKDFESFMIWYNTITRGK
jgi:hypothetical protein